MPLILEDAAEIQEQDLYDNIPKLQSLRDDFQRLQLGETAEFFTDKIVTLLHDDHDKQRLEIYKLAKSQFQKGEFHRAADMIEKKDFQVNDISCRLLVAKCFYQAKEYQAGLSLLRSPIGENMTSIETDGKLNEWKSSVELLKGKIYQKLEQFTLAKRAFLKTLHYNINCYEAFKQLVSYDVLTNNEENILLQILDIKPNDFQQPDSMIKYLYLSEFDKKGRFKEKLDAWTARLQDVSTAELQDDVENSMSRSPPEYSCENKLLANAIIDSLDIKLNHAEKLYLSFDFFKCYEILEVVFQQDPFNQRALLMQIGCLLELDRPIDLYSLSHKLVETYAENPLSWYSVGCYYYKLRNFEAAQKHFEKSLTFDFHFFPTLLMLGHLYEQQSLHDRSLAVYLDLSKRMVNSHLPFLYAGVEYVHSNSMVLGEKFILKALDFAPNDPIVLHELGNLCYMKKNYLEAFKHFQRAYEIITTNEQYADIPVKWEPLINNLGHCARQLGKYELALEYHTISIKINPNCCSTFVALGLVYYKMRNLERASDTLNQAMSIDRSNVVASTLYNRVFEEMLDFVED